MTPRRIARLVLALGLAAAPGCGSSYPYRNVGTANPDPAGRTRVVGALPPGGDPVVEDEEAPRAFARRNVPDEVMLRDEARAGYSDDTVPR